MNRAMYGIQFNGCNNVETGLLETVTQAARSGKQINGNWDGTLKSSRVLYQAKGVRLPLSIRNFPWGVPKKHTASCSVVLGPSFRIAIRSVCSTSHRPQINNIAAVSMPDRAPAFRSKSVAWTSAVARFCTHGRAKSSHSQKRFCAGRGKTISGVPGRLLRCSRKR